MAEKRSKLKVKLIITIILFALAIAMMGIGIWASQAGKDRWKADLTISTEDVNIKVSSYVTGATNTTDIGYSENNQKVLIDVNENDDVIEPANWRDINFTFADKNTPIELIIVIENRKVDGEIDVLFEVNLGDYMVTDTPTEIGESNVIAHKEYVNRIMGATSASTPRTEIFKIVLEVAEPNKDVKPTELNISLTLTNVEQG